MLAGRETKLLNAHPRLPATNVKWTNSEVAPKRLFAACLCAAISLLVATLWCYINSFTRIDSTAFEEAREGPGYARR